MWASIARSAIALIVLTFMAWLLNVILQPMIDTAMASDYAGAQAVQTTHTFFQALTVANLTLIAAFAVGAYLLGRAAVEANLR